MKFYTSTIIMALAATVLAAPADLESRHGGGGGGGGGDTTVINTGNSCDQYSQQVCCSGLLNCLVQEKGASCSSEQYCCQTSAPVGGLINVALLNCATLL